MTLRRVLLISSPALLLLLPLVLRPRSEASAKRSLVIITPHGEQIRSEFGRAFALWARREKGIDVSIDWRAPGGTSDIVKFLDSQYAASVKRRWPGVPKAASEAFASETLPGSVAETMAELVEAHRKLRKDFLESDVGCGHDIFFGGGEFPHRGLANKGYLVDAGLLTNRAEWFGGANGIPMTASGETLVDPKGRYYGACLSVFGVCANPDRLALLADARVPTAWRDLGEPRFFGSLTFADPTKSGVVVTTFERIFQQEIQKALAFGASNGASKEEGLEKGWAESWALIKRMNGNARFVSDGASRAARDIVKGDAAAGFAIDFHARSEASFSARESGGRERILFRAPLGGTSVSADPIALLRGARERALAVDFITFVLSPEGQRLWNAKIGSPGGTTRYELRRLAIRPDAYAPSERAFKTDPDADPWTLASNFTYRRELTAPIYSLLAPLTKSLCIDALDECRAAWKAILDRGGPERVPEAARVFSAVPVRYADAKRVLARWGEGPARRLEMQREWTLRARRDYARSIALAREGK